MKQTSLHACAGRRGVAFTLIELLAVISIIMLLAALLMPALQRVKFIAQNAACQSNLRQIGVAFAAYGAHYDGQIPPCYAWIYYVGEAGFLGKPDHYVGYLQGFPLYGGNRWKVCRCPSEYNMKRLDPRLAKNSYYDNEMCRTSYTMNWYVQNYQYYGGDDFRVKRPPDNPFTYYNSKKGSNETITVTFENATFIADGGDQGYGWTLDYWLNDADLDNPTSYWLSWTNVYSYAFRHFDKINVLFLDGHVNARLPKHRTGVPALWVPIWWDNPAKRVQQWQYPME